MSKHYRAPLRTSMHWGLSLLVFLMIGTAAAQGIRDSLFREVDVLRQRAADAKSEILSPRRFADAEEAYAEAESEMADGRADRAKKSIAEAVEAYRSALETSELAAVSFEPALEARDLAVAANSARYAPELWEEAEDDLNKAARKLESGNVGSAKRPAADAAKLYDQAELAAIKSSIVGTARKAIRAAEDADMDDYAPVTLDRARELVAMAEAGLTEDRYTTARPQLLAAEAEYETRHANYLGRQAEAVEDESTTVEALLLAWEAPLRELVDTLGASTDMTAGPAGPLADAQARAEELKTLNADMSRRLVVLEEELGASTKIAREAEMLQDQLRATESLFRPGQALVLRQGDDLIMRLVGLTFPVGDATIQTDSYGILRQVQRAIEVYPNSTVIIEGHTDSQGNETLNRKLSQQRADAVREYLLANSNLEPGSVRALGYGSERPISSEATAEGRANNRRIDVVIRDARATENL